MAKRKAGVNKTELIKNALAKNPDASPTEIAKDLAKYKITPQYVSVVKSSMKKKTTKKTVKKPGNKSSKRSTKTSEPAFTVSELVKANKLAEELGGIRKAKEVLDAIERIS